MRTKGQSFKNNLASTNYDVILLTETWLTNSFHDAEFFSNQYAVFRNDRNYKETNCERGGGVLIAVRLDLKAEQLEFESKQNEMWVKFKLKNTTYIIGVIYFKPQSNTEKYESFLKSLESIENLLLTSEVLLAGDFNIPEISDATYNLENGSSKAKVIKNLASMYNLRSINTIKNSDNRTLDLILTNINAEITTASDLLDKVNPLHPALQVIHQAERKINQTRTTTNYNFKKADFYKMYLRFRDANWESLTQIDYKSVNDAVTTFYEIVYKIFDECVPKVTIRITNKYPIWFDLAIIKKIKLKNKHRTRGKSEEFKEDRKELKKMIRDAYKKYIRNIEVDLRSNSNKFWGYVRSLTSTKQLPEVFEYKTIPLEDPKSIADAFASYKEENLDPNDGLESDLVQSKLHLTNIQESELLESIKVLKPRAAIGEDGIPPYVLKGCAHSLGQVTGEGESGVTTATPALLERDLQSPL
ncbi:uncharacterized protein LOC116181632 [Photinus pyralis]|uniref:uncharacterized protein LOC116181632 n=1 Tax=Photinus pyralis TaxID=7054 RepID=UPI001267272A|nr:uncharacterized protein LOC116181632 [Photinus pyralis]